MAVKTTERELAAWLCEGLNALILAGGYQFEICTVEPGILGKKRRFPDIVIWKNRNAGKASAIIELKAPYKLEDFSRL